MPAVAGRAYDDQRRRDAHRSRPEQHARDGETQVPALEREDHERITGEGIESSE